MAKSSNQKLKLLYIVKILQEKTNDTHGITTNDLIKELEKYEIKAERKSIYTDMEALQDFGYDIVNYKTRKNGGYRLLGRSFELPELKLLVDAVQASRFITLKKSRELISKLSSLTNEMDARQLKRQVYVSDRIKTENESIYYNVDYIHRAIQENLQISFRYFEWNVEKKMQFKRGGLTYKVSPHQLIWNDENYYLVAYDEAADMLKHYRVDKMNRIALTKEKRKGIELFQKMKPANYSSKTFSMFGGEEETVTIEFENRLAGVVIDRFGKDVEMRIRDEEHFSVRVNIAVSTQFFGWLTGLGSGVRILRPEKVRDDYQKHLQAILQEYKDSIF